MPIKMEGGRGGGEMTEFEQAARQFEAMSEKERETLADNIAESLLFTDELVREAVLGHFRECLPGIGKIFKKQIHFLIYFNTEAVLL